MMCAAAAAFLMLFGASASASASREIEVSLVDVQCSAREELRLLGEDRRDGDGATRVGTFEPCRFVLTTDLHVVDVRHSVRVLIAVRLTLTAESSETGTLVTVEIRATADLRGFAGRRPVVRRTAERIAEAELQRNVREGLRIVECPEIAAGDLVGVTRRFVAMAKD